MSKFSLVYRFTLNILLKIGLIMVIVGGILVFFKDYTIKAATDYVWNFKVIVATFALVSSVVSHSYELPIPEIPCRGPVSAMIFAAAFPLIGEGFFSC